MTSCFTRRINTKDSHIRINVTSFSSISYWSNTEYWPQKHTQSGNINSIILDVHAVKQSALKLSYNLAKGGNYFCDTEYTVVGNMAFFAWWGRGCQNCVTSFMNGSLGDPIVPEVVSTVGSGILFCSFFYSLVYFKHIGLSSEEIGGCPTRVQSK